MNVAILLAGGTGQRLGAGKPKQFVEILGKPLIAYTMEIYERSPNIDALEIVCIPEYIDAVWELAREYGISKLRWVTPGGASCQESTKNGIFNLEGVCSEDDMLMLNMSTSLFVSEDIIEDSLRVAKEYGNAFACMQCIYNLAYTEDGVSSSYINFKERHKTLNMPWTAPFGTFNRLYKKAYAENIEISETSYAPTLFLALGEKLYMSKDTSLNKLHVTTPEDVTIITAILEHERCKKEEI